MSSPGKEAESLLGDPEQGTSVSDSSSSIYGATTVKSTSVSGGGKGELLVSSSEVKGINNNSKNEGDDDGDDADDPQFVPLKERGWSFQEGRRMIMTSSTRATGNLMPNHHQTSSTAADLQSPKSIRSYSTAGNPNENANDKTACSGGADFYLYSLIYALVNVIISAPGLYGYAAVIFNHPVFANHMNALSKLVIFSSLVHQLGFFLFSSLDFAIGTVQDAGLVFLSGMANTIANKMQDQGHSESEIVSTTLVLLSLGTASLGLILVVMGHFRLADAVSYLPMPVVGGYLAFIGFFCIQAGIALCISKSITSLDDWSYLLDSKLFILALPGLLAGLVLTLVSRKATNSGALPLIMVSIPALFYLILWIFGSTLDEVREEGWVGKVAPSVPVGDLFKLVDFSEVRWDLVADILPTWVGMVFVVSFASCLDVAAISIDMGEALDTNRELATVGLCNFMSGLTFGFTGSYIFSQTIFTYRTGVHSRLIGVMIMAVFLYIVLSPVNVLQISPLFFLGSTLIFIGYDLVWEWLWEVRNQVFLSEYGIVWLTFVAIQVVGIDAGIVLGVLIAIVEQIVTTAQTSNIVKVERRSRAVWSPSDAKLLHDYAYSSIGGARIMTLEMHGNVFFGSALTLLNSIIDEIGLYQGDDNSLNSANPLAATPHSSSTVLTLDRRSSSMSAHHGAAASTTAASVTPPRPSTPPKYLVLDLTRVSHLDASATRGCFLQLVKLCAKRDIVVCASGATPRIEWMFRSHGVSMEDLDDENGTKAKLLSRGRYHSQRRPLPRSEDGKDISPLDKILLFITVQEALEFCETMLLHRLNRTDRSISLSTIVGPEERSLADILIHMLGSDEKEQELLKRLDSSRYHDELELKSGEHIFHRNTYPDSFFVVMSGVVANSTSDESMKGRQELPVVSGAGLVSQKRVGSASNLFDEAYKAQNIGNSVATLWQVGGVFGYNDYLLDRPRGFGALSTLDGTRVARITHSHMNLAHTEDPQIYNLLQKLLLHASTLDLSNCTCHDV